VELSGPAVTLVASLVERWPGPWRVGEAGERAALIRRLSRAGVRWFEVPPPSRAVLRLPQGGGLRYLYWTGGPRDAARVRGGAAGVFLDLGPSGWERLERVLRVQKGRGEVFLYLPPLEESLALSAASRALLLGVSRVVSTEPGPLVLAFGPEAVAARVVRGASARRLAACGARFFLVPVGEVRRVVLELTDLGLDPGVRPEDLDFLDGED